MDNHVTYKPKSATLARAYRWLSAAALGFTLLLILGGCHSWRDERVRLGGLPLPVRTEVFAKPDWAAAEFIDTWTRLEGDTLAPSLEQLHRWAREFSPQVRTASAALAAAQARAGYAGRWADPEIDGRVLNFDEDYELEAALMFELPLNRSSSAAGKAASFELARAEADLATTRLKAVRDIDFLIAKIFSEQARADAYESLAKRATAFAELARQRQVASLADPIDVSLVLAEAAQDHRAAIRSRDELNVLSGELNLLLGLSRPVAVRHLAASNLAARVPAMEELLNQASQTSPDWVRAQLAYQQAEWEAIHAGRRRIPNPSLGPAVVFDQEQTTWGVSLGLELPFFSNRGAVYREALAHRDLAYEELVAAGNQVVKAIERLHHKLQALDKQLDATLGAPMEASEQALLLARERYEAGKIDVLLLLSAHRTYADMRLEVLDLSLQRQATRFELEQVAGGTFAAEPLIHE